MTIEIENKGKIFSTEEEYGLFEQIDYIKKHNRNKTYFIKLTNNIYESFERTFDKLVINLLEEKNDDYFNYYNECYKFMKNQLFTYTENNNKNQVNLEDDELMRFLYATIEFHCLQHIIIVDSKIMHSLGEIKYHKEYKTINNIDQLSEKDIKITIPVIRKMETLGMFFEKLYIKDIPEELKNKFIEKGLTMDIKELKKIIFICPENQEFFLNKLPLDKKEKLDKAKLQKLVLSHEIGHLIFNSYKTNNRIIQERQANLISSYLNDGSLDQEIIIKTNMQLEEYKNPLLISDKTINHEYFIKKLEELYEEGK